MGIKVFDLGGTELKASDLIRRNEDARYTYNIMYNVHGEYVKRPGTDIDSSISNNYTTYPNASNVVFIKSLNEYFYSDGVNYHRIKNGVDETIPGFIGAEANVKTTIQGAEYLNTFIFTHQSNQFGTYKYDGNRNGVYKAGLPAPIITGTTAGTLFLLSFYEFIDAQGNILYGPATITPNVNAATNVTFSTLYNTGFYSSDILEINVSQITPTILSKTNNSVTVPLAGNYSFSVGDYVIVRNNSLSFGSLSNGLPVVVISEAGGTNPDTQDFFLRLKITSINPTTRVITFDPDSFQDRQITISTTTTGIYNIAHSTVLRLFTSTSETTGYDGYFSNVSLRLLNNSATNTRNIVLNSAIDKVLLSDFYDITTDKLRPPKCKYIINYGIQLVYIQALSFWDFKNKETNYTNNDLIMYSDISNGDLGENVSALNRQLIGDTYDGELTGGTRGRDSLIVFKDRSVYALDGVLVPGQYSLRKIETNEIGCLSQDSIIATDGYILFQGQDGIYNINGFTCRKLSTSLDPFFYETVLDKSKTKSVIMNEINKHLFFTDSGVAVYDYQFNKWFLWFELNASMGLIVNNNREVKMFRTNGVYKFKSDLNDSGTPILAYFKTSWFHMGEPSLLKKATDIRLFAPNNKGQSVSLSYYMGWSESKVKGPYVLDFSDQETKTVLRKLNIIQDQSFSFKIENNELNEDLNLCGYEVISGIIQTRDKNVK